MTEQELIETGFTRVDVPVEESGNKNDYYYYTLAVCEGFELISDESDNRPTSNWKVYCYEMNISIKKIEDVETIVALFRQFPKI
jgi:hypothetical protein